MSEVKGRVIKKLKYEILDQKFNKIATNSDGVWAGYQLTHKVIADFVDQILSIPEIARGLELYEYETELGKGN